MLGGQRDSGGSCCWTVNYIFEINADSAADGVKTAAAAVVAAAVEEVRQQRAALDDAQ